LFDASLRKCNYASNTTCAEITTTSAQPTTTFTTTPLTTTAGKEKLSNVKINK
jgi:hypothetical protein